MSKKHSIFCLLYTFFCLSGSVYGIGEKTVLIGSGASWELIETRRGVAEAAAIRPGPVLVLSPLSRAELPEPGNGGDFTDLSLSFDGDNPGAFSDSRGNYSVEISPGLGVAAAPMSRAGSGAALFGGGESPLKLRPKSAALFAPGNHVRDFSIEFWLFPQSLENGEQIFLLESSETGGPGALLPRRIQCAASRNRLEWRFTDFFFAPGGSGRLSLVISGPPLLPRKWSHHLVRFDADLGLLEYLVDGRTEALEYATSTGGETGEVHAPVIGENCTLTLGGRFSGMMDEFRVLRCYLPNPALAKYPASGGRVETRTLDLGSADSRVIKIEVLGGRTSAGNSAVSGKPENEYAGKGPLVFPDHAEMKFYIRAANSLYRWNELPWIPFDPGTELREFRGRYIQIAADFYPGESGETSPYLAELALVYDASEPPRPPTGLVAAAKDGAVELSWKASPSRHTSGYMVYFGSAGGEYFGDHAILGGVELSSPMDVGNRTSVRVEGLTNGTLYYFAVAAYGRSFGDSGPFVNTGERPPLRPGEFSREVSARPLPMVPRGDKDKE